MGRETDNKTIDRKTAASANVTTGAKGAAVSQNNAAIKSAVGTKNTAAVKGTANTKGTVGAKTTVSAKTAASAKTASAGTKSTVGIKNTAATKSTAAKTTAAKTTTGKKGTAKKPGSKHKKSKSIAKKSASIFSKLTFKIAMYVIGIVLVILVCKGAYDFGTKVFSEEGMAEEGSGIDVVITIPADASTSEIASILKDNGLIESELIFKIQTILYEAEIYSGTYTVNTEYNAEELIDALRPSDE